MAEPQAEWAKELKKFVKDEAEKTRNLLQEMKDGLVGIKTDLGLQAVATEATKKKVDDMATDLKELNSFKDATKAAASQAWTVWLVCVSVVVPLVLGSGYWAWGQLSNVPEIKNTVADQKGIAQKQQDKLADIDKNTAKLNENSAKLNETLQRLDKTLEKQEVSLSIQADGLVAANQVVRDQTVAIAGLKDAVAALAKTVNENAEANKKQFAEILQELKKTRAALPEAKSSNVTVRVFLSRSLLRDAAKEPLEKKLEFDWKLVQPIDKTKAGAASLSVTPVLAGTDPPIDTQFSAELLDDGKICRITCTAVSPTLP